MKPMAHTSQEAAILEHLQSGKPITPLEALELYGCFRIAARIWSLRKQGFVIDTEDFITESGKRVARYWLRSRYRREKQSDLHRRLTVRWNLMEYLKTKLK